MHIELIDMNYQSVSILEEITEIEVWLQETPYLAVIDETLKAVGIVTMKDVLSCNVSFLIDCDFIKPSVEMSKTSQYVFCLMQNSGNDYLPVYNKKEFLGVVSTHSIKSTLSEIFPC